MDCFVLPTRKSLGMEEKMLVPTMRRRIAMVYMLVKILRGRQSNNTTEQVEDKFLIRFRDAGYRVIVIRTELASNLAN